MKEILDIPRTAMEVYETLPEGTRCEVIDNTIYMSPSPTTYHQRLLFYFARKIQDCVEQNKYGEVILSPCDVYLDGGNSVVQPDILFIKQERDFIIEKKGIYGAPDFVIELLSSNKTYDQQIKLDLYQRNAVSEYHILDPDTKQVWSYLLTDGVYKEQISASGSVHIYSIDFDIEF